ncbi:T9SS type A sorting domain-containing protein [Aquiflexum sp. LQ15W]|uniref:T9SS type A sorting domain-containing protein n=1 Tax=Cognataquiflexum nitidum TaxID=2922272 RepID=UPI001F12B30C|nr:T9SS type A sorting domain-containing protein [Cognataquiflexum nitidum]MCH6199772.1 T9SS type A sorting domain-containing protein [Cognataquiflexum nitidum]
MRYLILILFFSTCTFVAAQQTFSFDQSKKIIHEGNEIPLPFAVGINASQYQRMDVNGDGEEEWVVWDINARRVLVFEEIGSEFKYLPEMSYFFPNDINGFLILADFDLDGKKDLFTSSPFGIKAYKNVSNSGDLFPKWEVAQNFLRLENGSNLTANNLDIPIILDIDGDGDLDIATFNLGDYVDFYLNTSVERKGTADIDRFAFPEPWWGRFEFCGCGTFSFGITCEGLPMGRLADAGPENRILHTGGHSMLYSDFDNDGVRDLLLGRDECNTLYFLPNKGTDRQPLFDAFSSEVPGFGTLPVFPIYHAAYLWENSLIISSNSSASAGVFKSDFTENVFEISKGSSGLPTQRPFLQSDMLDLGENSRPYYKGLTTSGELVLTANSLLNGKVLGMAYRYSVDGDSWELIEKDFLGLSNLDFTDLQYFDYLNAANQQTFWISGVDTVNNSLQRRIFSGRNQDFTQMQEVLIPRTIVRPFDHLELFVFEGKDYLLLARQTGELLLYSIDLSASPVLTVLEEDFLGFSDNPGSRNLSVHVIQGQKPSLYAIDQRGILFHITDFMNQSEGETVQVLLSENRTSQTKFGRNTWITSLAKPFSEERDLLLGNTAGGLEYLKYQGEGTLPGDGEFLAKIYPNPNSGIFKVLVSQSGTGRIVNSLGQIMAEDILIPANVELEIQLPSAAPGLYIFQFTNEKGIRISKKMIVL